MKKNDKSEIIGIGMTFIGFIIAFNLFVQEVIKSSGLIQGKINDVIVSSNMEVNQISILIIIITSLVAISTIGIYFVVNRLILMSIKSNNIDSSKLLITILTSSIPGPTIGFILLSISKINSTNKILNIFMALSVPIMMSFLLEKDFTIKKQYRIYTIILIIVAIVNIIISASIV